MDEDQFRAVYHAVNPQRCVFEKAINNRRCECLHKQPFLLATREGIACTSAKHLAQCTQFLEILRNSSRFALRETMIDGPLPHNKELKVQAGGCTALSMLLSTMKDTVSDIQPDISELLVEGIDKYNSIEAFPFNELVKGVVNYQSRHKSRRG